jgi:hypothetical protein
MMLSSAPARTPSSVTFSATALLRRNFRRQTARKGMTGYPMHGALSGPARRKDWAWISLCNVADPPYGRDRWIRWDQELTSTCPECGRLWADHPRGIQLWAQDGHLGRVLQGCPQGCASQVAGDDTGSGASSGRRWTPH